MNIIDVTQSSPHTYIYSERDIDIMFSFEGGGGAAKGLTDVARFLLLIQRPFFN